MQILLQQTPPDGGAPRYMQLTLQADLFGGWELVRETGQQGARSSLRREQFPDQAAALAAIEKARDAQLKKGFQLMFASGFDGPR